MSEVAEANPIQDLIQNTIDQNYTGANGNFADIMTLKLNDVLDQEKIRLADQIYNGVEEGDEDEDEQLELDLDGGDEEVSDESSDDQDPEEDGYEVDDEAEDEFEETEDEDEE